MNQADLIAEALKLDPSERASMADRLLASLDELSAVELDDLWADEAQRRDIAVQQGQLTSIPAALLIAEIKGV